MVGAIAKPTETVSPDTETSLTADTAEAYPSPGQDAPPCREMTDEDIDRIFGDAADK